MRTPKRPIAIYDEHRNWFFPFQRLWAARNPLHSHDLRQHTLARVFHSRVAGAQPFSIYELGVLNKFERLLISAAPASPIKK